MNGATAEPLVSTTRPPNRTIIKKIGSSQYFLRTSTKRQSTARKSIVRPLELILHRLGSGTRRLPDDPIAVAFGLTFQAEQVPAHRPHHKPRRQHRDKEQQPHTKGSDIVVEHQADLEPDPMERPEHGGAAQRSRE